MVRTRACSFFLSVACIWLLLVMTSRTAYAQARFEWSAAANGFIAPAAPSVALPLVARTVVYLHGIGGRPENGCGYFIPQAGAHETVCPRAPLATAPGYSWSGAESTLQTIARATAATAAASNRLVLAGFSQGGYALAAALPKLAQGRVRGVLVLGANVTLSAAELRSYGVDRIALGAGRYDQTYSALRRTCDRLNAAGFPAHFVDLGGVGHTYIAEGGATVVADAVAWLAETDATRM